MGSILTALQAPFQAVRIGRFDQIIFQYKPRAGLITIVLYTRCLRVVVNFYDIEFADGAPIEPLAAA